MTSLNDKIKEAERKMAEDCRAMFGSRDEQYQHLEALIRSFDGTPRHIQSVQ